MEYSEISIDKILELTYLSSDELGAHGSLMWDCESGLNWDVGDSDTAMFLASARSIVLELCRRLRQNEKE